MSFWNDFAMVWGAAPQKPQAISPQAQAMHQGKRGTGAEVREKLRAHAGQAKQHKWRNRRWAVLVAINLLFTISFWLDIQLVEGSITASRLLGFHLADVYSGFLILLAGWIFPVNLVLGMATVWLLWGVLGGRAFCAWVCPYHLLAEWAETLQRRLVEKKLVTDHSFHRGLRTLFWLFFLLLAALTGQTLFLTLNPIGILSRALVYGPTLALGWVVLLLAFEIVYSRRSWCRYFCPIGLTYGVIGVVSPVGVVYSLENCVHEGECRAVCEVPHVLDLTIRGRAEDVKQRIGPDCTRCGLCVDVCPTGSLRFEVKKFWDFL